jgi:hypothetical protein
LSIEKKKGMITVHIISSYAAIVYGSIKIKFVHLAKNHPELFTKNISQELNEKHKKQFLEDSGDYISINVFDCHKVIRKDLYVKECRHSSILFKWKCGISWRRIENSEIKINSFSKDLHSKLHYKI